MNSVIAGFEKEHRFSTARLFRYSLRALEAYRKGLVTFQSLTREMLSEYEAHLLQRSLSLNTVSTYLRMLRATYHRAVAAGLMPEVADLFHGVFTGTRSDVKRALDVREAARLLTVNPRSVPPSLSGACMSAQLMFLLWGIPFADLARLRKRDLSHGSLSYCRRKTGKLITVAVSSEAMELIRVMSDERPDSIYLLPILDDELKSEAAIYRDYTSCLRRFNRQLAELAQVLGLREKLSSYTLRHTWATTALRRKLPVALICNALGHSSITVTETYLKPFASEEIDRASQQMVSYIKSLI